MYMLEPFEDTFNVWAMLVISDQDVSEEVQQVNVASQ
jgi:hypothetical protein